MIVIDLMGVYVYRHKLDVVSSGRNVSRVQKAISSGFFRNAARKVSINVHVNTYMYIGYI